MLQLKIPFAIVAISVLGACTSSSPAEGHHPNGDSQVDLTPPESGKGVQLQMLSDLAPGVETERCSFYVAPPEGLHVNAQTVRFTAGSHHVLLFSTPYKAIPTKDRFGTDIDTSGVFECGTYGPTAHWEVDGVVGGSQTAAGAAIVGNLPADVAVTIPAGAVLLMNTHYMNASSAVMKTDARINLLTVPKEQVKREAGFLFLYNPFISVPPMSKGEAREVCPVLEDVTLLNAQSHMHKRGVGYTAQLLAADNSVEGEPIYTTTEWSEVKMKEYAVGRELKKGQALDFRCQYDNQTDRTITQGLSANDEMCMLIGLYYPRNRQFELCGLDNTWDAAFINARWIGNGTKSGLETVGCIISGQKDEDLYGCVVSSCPKISTPVSDAARCLSSQGYGQCAQQCMAPADGQPLSEAAHVCSKCRAMKCEASMTALAAASCE